MENEIAKSIYLFLLSRVWYLLWKLLCNLFRNISNSALSYLLVKKTNSASIKSTQYFADLDSIDIDSVWKYSKPAILRRMKENIITCSTNHPIFLKSFALSKGIKIESQFEIDAIWPIVLEYTLGNVFPKLEYEPQGLVIVKLIVPAFFIEPKPGLVSDWFQKICIEAMSPFINGYFEVDLERRETYEFREQLQEMES